MLWMIHSAPHGECDCFVSRQSFREWKGGFMVINVIKDKMIYKHVYKCEMDVFAKLQKRQNQSMR